MSVWFARTIAPPVWMILFTVVVLSTPPFGATTGPLQSLGLALALSAVLAVMASVARSSAPRLHTPHGTAVAVLPAIDLDSQIAVFAAMRRALATVVAAGARFWPAVSVPAVIPPQAQAASDTHVPSYLGRRSPAQASRGLGPRQSARGRARGGSPLR